MSGDFFQLPPVTPSFATEKELPCFRAQAWSKLNPIEVELMEVLRQEDETYVRHLSDIRTGQCTPETIDYLNTLKRPLVYEEVPVSSDKTVTLFSKRIECFLHNSAMLDALPGDSIRHLSQDSGNGIDKLDSLCQAPRTLSIKIGGRVILLKNLSQSLVNGLCGVVIAFSYDYPVVRFDNGHTMCVKEATFSIQTAEDATKVAHRKQIPLCLGWALTIHKAQGMTIKFLRVSLSDLFVHGQGYTAISRATSPQTVEVMGLDSSIIRHKPPEYIAEFYRKVIPFMQAQFPPPKLLWSCPEEFEDEGSSEVQSQPEVSEEVHLPGQFFAPSIEPPATLFKSVHEALQKSALSHSIGNYLLLLLSGDANVYIPSVRNFIKWIYNESLILFEIQADGTLSANTEKNHIEGIVAPGFHKLLNHADTIQNWQLVFTMAKIDISDLDVSIESVESRLLMTLLARQTFRCIISQLYDSLKNKLPEDEVDKIDKDFSPEMKGTVRYISGWVVRKEILRASKYIERNCGSPSPSVQERCKSERSYFYSLSRLRADKGEVSTDP